MQKCSPIYSDNHLISIANHVPPLNCLKNKQHAQNATQRQTVRHSDRRHAMAGNQKKNHRAKPSNRQHRKCAAAPQVEIIGDQTTSGRWVYGWWKIVLSQQCDERDAILKPWLEFLCGECSSFQWFSLNCVSVVVCGTFSDPSEKRIDAEPTEADDKRNAMPWTKPQNLQNIH